MARCRRRDRGPLARAPAVSGLRVAGGPSLEIPSGLRVDVDLGGAAPAPRRDHFRGPIRVPGALRPAVGRSEQEPAALLRVQALERATLGLDLVDAAHGLKLESLDVSDEAREAGGRVGGSPVEGRARARAEDGRHGRALFEHAPDVAGGSLEPELHALELELSDLVGRQRSGGAEHAMDHLTRGALELVQDAGGQPGTIRRGLPRQADAELVGDDGSVCHQRGARAAGLNRNELPARLDGARRNHGLREDAERRCTERVRAGQLLVVPELRADAGEVELVERRRAAFVDLRVAVVVDAVTDLLVAGVGHAGVGHAGVGHAGVGHAGVGHTGIRRSARVGRVAAYARVIRLAGASLVELPLRDGEFEPHICVFDPGAVDAVLAARGDLRGEAALHGLFTGLELVRGSLGDLGFDADPDVGARVGSDGALDQQIDVGGELDLRADGDPDGLEWVDVVLECRVDEWFERGLPSLIFGQRDPQRQTDLCRRTDLEVDCQGESGKQHRSNHERTDGDCAHGDGAEQDLLREFALDRPIVLEGRDDLEDELLHGEPLAVPEELFDHPGGGEGMLELAVDARHGPLEPEASRSLDGQRLLALSGLAHVHARTAGRQLLEGPTGAVALDAANVVVVPDHVPGAQKPLHALGGLALHAIDGDRGARLGRAGRLDQVADARRSPDQRAARDVGHLRRGGEGEHDLGVWSGLGLDEARQLLREHHVLRVLEFVGVDLLRRFDGLLAVAHHQLGYVPARDVVGVRGQVRGNLRDCVLLAVLDFLVEGPVAVEVELAAQRLRRVRFDLPGEVHGDRRVTPAGLGHVEGRDGEHRRLRLGLRPRRVVRRARHEERYDRCKPHQR